MEGDTSLFVLPVAESTFQSTPSAWRETEEDWSGKALKVIISIHSLRMEGDASRLRGQPWHDHFNPLPPHGGRLYWITFPQLMQTISIHSLRMEGDYLGGDFATCLRVISIHSLRMEGDVQSIWFTSFFSPQFQSTPSAWRETLRQPKPSAGSNHFNPLPPHGGRRV